MANDAWTVALFGVLIVPLGVTHIVLVMSQPVPVHEWSTFALLAAGLMLFMFMLTVDEVVAVGQHMRDAIRRGDRGGSGWSSRRAISPRHVSDTVLWLGGKADGSSPHERTSPLAHPERPALLLRALVRGASRSWNLLTMAGLRIWL